METPYDKPEKIWERVMFPSLKIAYEQGANDMMDAIANSVGVSNWRDDLKPDTTERMSREEEEEFFRE